MQTRVRSAILISGRGSNMQALLDAIAHTGNGPGTLDASGYSGAGHYRDVPHPVQVAQSQRQSMHCDNVL